MKYKELKINRKIIFDIYLKTPWLRKPYLEIKLRPEITDIGKRFVIKMKDSFENLTKIFENDKELFKIIKNNMELLVKIYKDEK
jgi:hypothetical protein